MRESLKMACVVVLMFAGIAAPLAWVGDPTALIWALRIGLPAVCLAALAGFLVIHFQQDRVPDYLYQTAGEYFDSSGFCFVPLASAEQGICFLDVWFQNRHEQSCIGWIAVRPARSLFKSDSFEATTFHIEAGPAAFGVARFPFPVPRTLQARDQVFEVGASVDYPAGKGRMLRFRDGIVVRRDSNFRSGFQTAVTLTGLAGGMFIRHHPATVGLRLPAGVAEEVPSHIAPKVKTIWQLGDPPLEWNQIN